MKWLAACALLGLALGCTPRPGVLRVEDDAYVLGAAHEPEAYSAMLEGVLAENDAKYTEAMAAYERALARAPGDPEIATRLYHASCLAKPAGAFSEEPRARKDWIEPALARGYAPAAAATITCLQRQGAKAPAGALREAQDKLVQTARDPALSAQASGELDASLELRLWVLLTAHPESNEARLALAECLARQEKSLPAAAMYADYARRQPSARRALLQKAEAFARHGEVYGARLIAGAALDAPSFDGAPLGTLPSQGSRLGLDEAIARGDERAVLRRASRARISLGETASRVLLAGDRVFAERLAHAVIDAGGLADPDAAAVLLALGQPLPPRLSGPPSESGRALLEHVLPRR